MTLEEVQTQVGRALQLLHKAVGGGDHSDELDGIIAGLIPPAKAASGNGGTAVEASGDPAAPAETATTTDAETTGTTTDTEPEPES